MPNLDFLKNIELTPKNILKIAGVILVGLVLFAITASVFKYSFGSLSRHMRMGWDESITGMPVTAPSMGGGIAHDVDYVDSYENYEKAVYYGEEGAVNLSVRNIASSILPPRPTPTLGNDAEEYEVTEYNATIETRDREGDCAAIANLKSHSYVVFESTNSYDQGCTFTFKVEHARVAEVLSVIEALNPKELSENTYTIKRQIDDYTSEEEILTKKLISIDETLASATRAYSELTTLATNVQDVESLARILDSRLQLIDRLTQERINVSAQIERLSRAKEDQLDRLVYTYFSVYVYENKYVRGEDIADSWKEALRSFVHTVNKVLQDVTVNLLAFLLVGLQFIIYAVIILVFAKYAWRFVKKYWNT